MSLYYWLNHPNAIEAVQRALAEDAERKILTHLESVNPQWVKFEMLCGQTGIAPDVMLHMLLVLLQDKRIEFDNDSPLTEVRVRFHA